MNSICDELIYMILERIGDADSLEHCLKVNQRFERIILENIGLYKKHVINQTGDLLSHLISTCNFLNWRKLYFGGYEKNCIPLHDANIKNNNIKEKNKDSLYNLSWLDKNYFQGKFSLNSPSGHEGIVWDIKFLNNFKQVATASLDGTVRVYDSKKEKFVGVLKYHDRKVNTMNNFTMNDGVEYLATGSSDSKVMVFNVKELSHLKTLKMNFKNTAVNCKSIISIDSNNDYLFAGRHDRKINVWEKSVDFPLLSVLEGHEGAVLSVKSLKTKENNSSNIIVSSSHDGTIRIWDLKRRKQLLQFNSIDNSEIGVFDFFQRGSIVAGDYNGKAYIVDVESCKAISVLSQHKKTVRTIMCGENNTFITGGYDKFLYMWDGRTNGKSSPIRKFAGHTDLITTSKFDHCKLISGGKSVLIHDLRKSGQPMVDLNIFPETFIRCLDFHGAQLIVGGGSERISRNDHVRFLNFAKLL